MRNNSKEIEKLLKIIKYEQQRADMSATILRKIHLDQVNPEQIEKYIIKNDWYLEEMQQINNTKIPVYLNLEYISRFTSEAYPIKILTDKKYADYAMRVWDNINILHKFEKRTHGAIYFDIMQEESNE